MKIKGETYFLFFIMLVIIYSGFESIHFDHYEAKIVPLLLSISIFVLGIIEICKEIISDNKKSIIMDNELTIETGTSNFRTIKRFFFAFAWICGVTIFTYFLGFFISIFIFGILYIFLKGYGWVKSILFSTFFVILIYLVFNVLFKSQLHKGIIFG